MTTKIILVILITSLATYISRFFGVFTSEKINEKSRIYRWFNCLAYSTLAALISRMLLFPSGDLSETTLLLRVIIILISISIFYLTKRNLVYPTIFSAIIMALLNNFWYEKISNLIAKNYNYKNYKYYVNYRKSKIKNITFKKLSSKLEKIMLDKTNNNLI